MVLWSSKVNNKTYLISNIVLPEYVQVLVSFPVDMIVYPHQNTVEEKCLFSLIIPGYRTLLQDIKAVVTWNSSSHHIQNKEQREMNVQMVTWYLFCAQFKFIWCLGIGALHFGLSPPQQFNFTKTIALRHAYLQANPM